LFGVKKRDRLPMHGQGHGHPCLRCKAGLGVALVDDFACAVFAAPALGGNPQFELDVIESLALAGVQSNLFLGHAAANTNNHGESVG
jgi:hypothetical protein